MTHTRYKIVFDKLSEIINEEGLSKIKLSETEEVRVESEEVGKLLQYIEEETEPEVVSYTST